MSYCAVEEMLCYGGNGKTVRDFLVSKPSKLTVALANEDCDHVFSQLLESYRQELVEGIRILAELSGAAEMKLVVPESVDSEKLSKELGVWKISVEKADFVDVCGNRGTAVFHYIDAINASDLMVEKPILRFVCPEGKPLEAVPIGSKLSDVIPAENIKAVMIDHCFYPAEYLDQEITEIMTLGSGVVRLIHSDQCMVQETLKEISLLRGKSCGKCTFCREGLYQLETSLKAMERPGSSTDTLEQMKELGEAMSHVYMCSLGSHASMPVLSALKDFRGELQAHCGKGKCPAGVCKSFLQIYIDPQKCEGCGDCMDVCPKDCIEGKKGFISVIDEFECDKCGKCVAACENNAVQFATGRVPKLPNRLTKVGRFKR